MTDLWIIYKSLTKKYTMAVSQWMTELYSQSLEKNIKSTEYFSITQKIMQNLTGLSMDRQVYIIKKLENSKLIKVRRRGVNNYYQINIKMLNQIVNDYKNSLRSLIVNGHKRSQIPSVVKETTRENPNSLEKTSNLEKPRYNNSNINNNIFSNINISSSNEEEYNIPKNGALATPPLNTSISNLDIKELLNYWKEIRINGEKLPQFRANSKSTKEASKIIHKILTGQHEQLPHLTKDQIKTLFYNHALEALHDDYSPKGKSKEYLRKTAINTFFWNPFTADNSPNRSRCLHLLESKPQKCNKSGISLTPVNDMANMTANRLMKIYQDKVDKFKDNKTTRNKFIRAGNMLYKFHLDNKLSQLVPPFELADDLIDAVLKQFNGKIQIGHLCSEFTFKKIFPDYLKELGELD